MDFSKFSDEQLSIAQKVAAEAKAQGVDPDFALALAMSESKFNPSAKSKSGAIGVMQLMPKTAKELGVNPANVDENIRGGIRYIKMLANHPAVKGDPFKITVAYNAGPYSTFFSSGDRKDIPTETLMYVAKIASLTGGDLPQSIVTGGREEVPQQTPPAPAIQRVGEMVQKAGTEAAQSAEGLGVGAIGGGAAGLVTGLAEGAKLGPASTLERMATAARQANAPAAPPAPAQNIPEEVSRILRGTTEDGATGRARMSGFNVETAQQAARAKEAEQLAERLRQMGVVSQGAPQVLAGQPGLTSSPHGVLLPRSATMTPAVTPPKPSGLEQVSQVFKEMSQKGLRGARALGGVARHIPVISYPLAGASIGSDVEAISQEMDKPSPDYADIALRGAGALGTALSMHPVTAPVGLPMATVAPLAATVRRKMMAEPEAAPLTPEEEEMYSRPAFRYPAAKSRAYP